MIPIQSSSSFTIKRLQNEIKMLKKKPMELIDTYPDEKDLFTWYFILKGPEKTDYEGGFYIGKIMISAGYPKTPIDFMMLTPNGRFEIDKKICLTNSGYHADEWSAMWNMTSILTGFISIMADDSTSGLSHIKRSRAERQQLAQDSFSYNITKYPNILKNFERFVFIENDGTIRMRTDKELADTVKVPKKKTQKVSNEENQDDTKKQTQVETKTDNLAELQTCLEDAKKHKSRDVLKNIDDRYNKIVKEKLVNKN